MIKDKHGKCNHITMKKFGHSLPLIQVKAHLHTRLNSFRSRNSGIFRLHNKEHKKRTTTKGVKQIKT